MKLPPLNNFGYILSAIVVFAPIAAIASETIASEAVASETVEVYKLQLGSAGGGFAAPNLVPAPIPIRIVDTSRHEWVKAVVGDRQVTILHTTNSANFIGFRKWHDRPATLIRICPADAFETTECVTTEGATAKLPAGKDIYDIRVDFKFVDGDAVQTRSFQIAKHVKPEIASREDYKEAIEPNNDTSNGNGTENDSTSNSTDFANSKPISPQNDAVANNNPNQAISSTNPRQVATFDKRSKRDFTSVLARLEPYGTVDMPHNSSPYSSDYELSSSTIANTTASTIASTTDSGNNAIAPINYSASNPKGDISHWRSVNGEIGKTRCVENIYSGKVLCQSVELDYEIASMPN